MKLLVLALIVSAVYGSTFHAGFNFKPSFESRQLYDSKLLHYVQMSGIFPDSKTFVDLRLKCDEKTILAAFDELLLQSHNRPSKEQLSDFINYNFDSESGLESWRPSDFVPEPSFLSLIKDSQLQLFARNVYNILPTLGRKIKPIVFKSPEQFSMIPVYNGFIVSSEKSKEFNYLESYWIIESLLISGMRETAKGMISNFIELQRQFGYIPSGDRYYYLGRSQPPLLSAMMAMYLQETHDIEFLRANIDAIEAELEYWLDTHSVVFKVAGREYSLLRYFTQSRGPRPEEYYQDFTKAQVFDNEQRQEQFYADVKSAAESGWVMSSRWIMNKNGSNLGDLSFVHTTGIVPVDLNAIYASAVQNLVNFYYELNDSRRGAHWLEIKKRWINSINEVLWNEAEGMWFDWDLANSQHRKHFYTSNLSPLSMEVVGPEFIKAKYQKIINYLRRSHILEYPGGVPSSLIKSGYLYDLPYAWPAQVSIVIHALEALQTQESSKLAFEVAQNLVRSIYTAYKTNKQLYAKYDVETPGKPLVPSDEYLNEEGFGGTLGVIIEILSKYGSTMTSVRGYVPFSSQFGQYSQFYSTPAQQNVNYQYSGFPLKPFVSVVKPELQAPVKPVYFNAYKQPSLAYPNTSLPPKPVLAEVKPEHVVPSVQETPEVTTLKDDEYTPTAYYPPSEIITPAPVTHYEQVPVTSTFVKPAVPSVVYPKPIYTSQSESKYSSTVKPIYVAPVQALPVKNELPSYNAHVLPATLKPAYVSVEARPEPVLPVVPAPLKPEYLPTEPAPLKLESLPVAPAPSKLEIIPVAPAPLKPEYLPVAPAPLKPEYLPGAPAPLKLESLPVAPVPQKSEYLYNAPAPVAPSLLTYTPKPIYVSPVSNPAYVSVQANVEQYKETPLIHSQWPEKKPEYVAEIKPQLSLEEKVEEIVPSTTSEPEYVSTTVQPDEVTLYPAKPALVTSNRPEIIPLHPIKPTFSSFPSWSKYSTPVKVPLVPVVKPIISVQPKPEHAEVQPELEVATTLAPKYEAPTTSRPQIVTYTDKPNYYPSLPIKQEYVHSVASYPAKEIDVQTSPVKPVYSLYLSSAKPFFATKPTPVAVPLQGAPHIVSYTSSSYHQPGLSYVAPAEYESSTIVEPESTTLAAGEYTTASDFEYPSTTLNSEFEYATTESQLVDATVKPQYTYVSSVQPEASPLSLSGSVYPEKKPYFAGYSTFSSQKQEDPKVQTTFISAVQSQSSSLPEFTPTVSVSIPVKQQVSGQYASQDQATVLQQSHFSYFDKPNAAPVVVATLPPKTEGFSAYTKFNVNSAKVNATGSSFSVTSKPQLFGSAFVFNKTVTPSFVTSTVNVSGVPIKNEKYQSGQYVSSSWQGSSYNKPFSYYSKPNRWNTYSNQYQPQYQTSQYQGQYHSQYLGAYNSGAYNSGAYNSDLYKPTVKPTLKPLVF